MDSDDAARRAVGLLTAVYAVMHEGGTDQDLRVMVRSVLADMNPDAIELELSETADVNTIAKMVAEQTRQQLIPPMSEIIATLVSGFFLVCRTYEKDGPNADIYGKLRELGLKLTWG